MILHRSLCGLLASLLLCGAFVSTSLQAAEQTGPSQAAQHAGPEYLHALQRAAQAYAQRDFTGALERIDVADHIQPEVPDTWNMRGAIYAEEHAYEKAADAFEHAALLEPGNFWPSYNLAQLLFMEKKYPAAQAAFQKLVDDRDHRELVQFKLVLLGILQGHPDQAKAVVDSMKVPSDTAAYYFANAAWAFSQKDEKQGRYWVGAGLKIFGIERSYPYYNGLADLGYVKKVAAKDLQGAAAESPTPHAAPLDLMQPAAKPPL